MPCRSDKISYAQVPLDAEAELRSVTGARLQQQAGGAVPTRWLQHIGPPPVQPAEAAAQALPGRAAATGMRGWLQSTLLRRAAAVQSRKQQQDRHPPEPLRSVLEAELSAAAARRALAAPCGLSLKLRSDFAETSAPLALRRHQLWLLGDSAAATASLLTRLAVPEASSDASRGGNSGGGQGGSGSGPSALTESQAEAVGPPPQPADFSGSDWRRSQAWFGSLWPAQQADQLQEHSGLLPIGVEYTDYGSGGGSLAQQCAVLDQLLRRMPASTNRDSSAGSAPASGAGLPVPTWRQRLLAAVQALRAPPAGRRMLLADRLPAALLCIVTQASTCLATVSAACTAATVAGIEVLVAAAPAAQAGALLSLQDQHGKSQPAVLRLQSAGVAQQDADSINRELFQAMLRAHARTHKAELVSKM